MWPKPKTRSRRHVPLRESLAAWLRPLAQPRDPVAPSEQFYRDRLDDARAAAGLATWPPNWLGHSYATYRLAGIGDSTRVSHELGNSTDAVHLRHYAALDATEEAAEWFGAGKGRN